MGPIHSPCLPPIPVQRVDPTLPPTALPLLLEELAADSISGEDVVQKYKPAGAWSMLLW